jgi:stage II sporulation protein D
LLYSDYPIKYKISNFFLLQLITIIVVIFFTLSCSTSKRIEKTDRETLFKKSEQIRVLLSESKKIKIDFDSDAEIIDVIGRRISVEKKSSVQFIYSNVGVKGLIKDKEVFSKEFLVVPKSNKYLLFNEKKYRGYFKIVTNSSSLMLINYLDIEDYVKGVILKEMPLGKGEDNFEAIKAFSILVRTYAMKKKLESKDFFDLYYDTKDQVYGGMSSESDITNSLVNLTKGQLLFYQNNIATIFYHSTCGGYTENVENVFKSGPIPYLISNQDNNPANCIISPRFNWEESLDENLIIKRLLE